MTVDLQHAETHLAELIAAAEAGEEVLISRTNGSPIKLTLDEPPRNLKSRELSRRQGNLNPGVSAPLRKPFIFGRLQGKLNLPSDWEERFDVMDDEITALMCDAPFSTNGAD